MSVSDKEAHQWHTEPATRSKDAIASQFNTVLVRLDEGQGQGHPLDGTTYSINLIILFCLLNQSDIQVAHVKVIFQLPEEYGSLEHPLPYVEWFTPPSLNVPIPELGFYCLSLHLSP